MHNEPGRQRLYLAARASKGGTPYQNKGTAYAIIGHRGLAEYTYWGQGYERNIAVMAVHAMIRLVDELQIHRIEIGLDVITNYAPQLKQGIESIYNDLIKLSLNRKPHLRHTQYSWNQFAKTQELCKIVYSQPTTQTDKVFERQAGKIAAKRAGIAADEHADGRAEGLDYDDGGSFDWLLSHAGIGPSE